MIFIKRKTKSNKIDSSERSKIKKLKNSGGEVKDIASNVPNTKFVTFSFKWAWQDSNLRPTDYESVALTN